MACYSTKRDWQKRIKTVSASLMNCTQDMALISKSLEFNENAVKTLENYADDVIFNVHYLKKLIRKWKESI